METSSQSVVLPRTWKNLLIDNKDALLCVIDQGVVSVAGFATSVMIGRHAPAELGTYYIALSIVLFILGFQEQMISTPYTIFQHQYRKSGLAGFRGSCLLQQFGLMLIAALFLVLVTAASKLGWLESSMVPSLVVLLCLMPALLMREVIRQYCFTHLENVMVLAIDTVITCLQIGGILALGYLGVLSGASAWAVIGAASLLTLGFWYAVHRPAIEFSAKQFQSDWNQNWSFGKWAVAGQLVGSLPTYVLPWMLAAAAGTKGTGFFAAGMTLVGVANIFNSGMANFLRPKAAQVYNDHGAAGLKQITIKMSLIFLLAIGGFVVLLAIFSGWITTSLFGSKYIGLQTVMTILGVAKLFESFSIAASNGLFVMERTRANFWADVILMIITLIAAVLLVFPYGVVGAALTSLVAAFTSSSLRFVILAKFLQQEIHAKEV